MRILLVNGNTTQAITERCAASARSVAGPGTEIVAATARTGPRIITTRTENALAIAGVLELYAEHAGAVDAAVVAVSFDTGLDALREAARCPVIGMTEAALLVAMTLGGPIGVVAPGRRSLNIYRELAERVGVAGRVIGYEAIDMRPASYDDPDECRAAIDAASRRLVDRGAESVVLAGAAFSNFVPSLQPDVPVPMVDGISAGVVLAEALVRLGYPKPRAGSYAALPPRDLVGVAARIAALFGSDETLG